MTRSNSPKQQFGLPAIGIPAEVLFHPELSNTEKILYGLIRNLAHSEKGCFASNKWLGGLLGAQPQTISNGIKNLKDWEVIVIEYTRTEEKQTRHIFLNPEYPRIYNEMLSDEGYKKINKGVLKKLYPSIKNLIGPYKKINSPFNIKEDSKEDNNNISISNKKLSIQEKIKPYLPLAKYLSHIIQTKKNILHTTIQINNWANDIRQLVEDNKVSIKRIKEVLKWYKQNIGGQYTPVIESGASLRSKFIKLEAAMERIPTSNGLSSGSRNFKKGQTKYIEQDSKL